jgi:hypothetical protein
MVLAVTGLCMLGPGCKRSPAAHLKGQSNLATTFYAKVVDQDGAPLSGVTFEFRVDAYPKNWTFATRGRPHDVSTVTATSDSQGAIEFELTGCVLSMINAERAGYRLLEELDGADNNIAFTRSIRLISWGDQQYISDPNNPAVFVFVRDGLHKVTTLPSRGGHRRYGGRWVKNEPAWPVKPSLDDVDWVGGQARVNVRVPLVFKAVDIDGNPLANVNIAMEVQRYRTIKEMRQDHYSPQVRTRTLQLTVKTSSDGLAHATVEGFRLIGLHQAWVEGTRWGDGPFPIYKPGLGPDFYARDLMDDEGNIIYRCDESNPIVIVMVNREQSESHVLPCGGGHELLDGQVAARRAERA